MKTQANAGINIAAVFISVLSITARAEDCNELLRLGYMNVNHSVSQYDSVVSAYNHFCSTSYNSASSDKKRGLQTSFDYLKTISGSLGFTWGKTLTQETWSQICEDENTYNKLSTYQSVDSSEISNTALSAWQNCLTLTARGLKTDFSPTQDLTGLTGALYWTGSSPISFLGVDNIGLGKASCEVTAYIGKKYVTQVVTPGTTFKLSTKAANFNCQRVTELDAENQITAQATRLTFKTSEGKLDFDLAPITLTQIEAKQIGGLYEQITSLGNRTKVLETFADTTANQISNLGKWTPVPKIYIGTLPVSSLTTITYDITNVPPDAKEVLVYAYISSGDAPGGVIEFKIFTKENSVEYSHYLFANGYGQNAVAYNSANIWLPITSSRTINVTSTGSPIGPKIGSGLFLVGYR